ncbi:hypothetical protein C5Y96_11995 [Blastopirellula marina]|uniref:Uncharacterized protein n=1 Tax=Blastopirellula marina TaxID=124 RepID=A0A2S8FGN4_9BACT|nr:MULTISPECIES: hypothetical protein [Pirellulaceae]PQO31074.1 hypothetical protein C5Y96_11995 [Blastopirellula marina]RCS51468.1 hypothetical protein DTL36_12005 [Bremerella cremea]
MLPATLHPVRLSLVKKMPNSSHDNPFQSPLAPTERPTTPFRQVRSLVSLTWGLFLMAGGLHIVAGLLAGNRVQLLVAFLSLAVGFSVLLPSIFTWLIGLAYATLMSVLSVGVLTTGIVEDRPLMIIGLAPLLLYITIMVLLIQTSSKYYWRGRPKE